MHACKVKSEEPERQVERKQLDFKVKNRCAGGRQFCKNIFQNIACYKIMSWLSPAHKLYSNPTSTRKQTATKKAFSSLEQRWRLCLGAVIVGVRGSPFMFLEMPFDYTHTLIHTCTHTQAQFKRGYIKRMSDLDDSLDVGTSVEGGGYICWEGVGERPKSSCRLVARCRSSAQQQ